MSSIAAETTTFASEFYHKCAEESTDKNIIVSPFSVSTALALLSQGAQSTTFDQIVHGLHFSNNDKSTIASEYATNITRINDRIGEAKLSIANQIYVKHGSSIKKTFKDIAVNNFKSGIESIDFVDSVGAATTINKFVEDKTNGKIKELIQSNAFNVDTRLVLVNAIHFEGKWAEPFKSHLTAPDHFYVDETNKKTVNFMHVVSHFEYAELNDLDATAINLKYVESKISFFVILPNSRTGLPALESTLKNYDLTKATTQLQTNFVEVFFPKFTFDYEIEIKSVLEKLGMTEMFGDNADLSGILESSEQISVSKAIHKAFINVNEKGTEAAAATALVATNRIASAQPRGERKIFKADHPFVFYIMDIGENTIIFSGRYCHLHNNEFTILYNCFLFTRALCPILSDFQSLKLS